MSRRLWKKVQVSSGAKFPIVLQNLLISIGYDSEFALLTINEESIKSIEQEINKDKSVLKDTKYENRPGDFSFDLGDKISILSLPKYCKKPGKLVEQFDEEETKDDLFARLNLYISKKKYRYVLNRENIVKCFYSNGKTRVLVVCSVCETQIPCFRLTHWKISNFSRHITKHEKNAENIPNTIGTNDSNIKSPDKICSFETIEFDENGLPSTGRSVSIRHTSNTSELLNILK